MAALSARMGDKTRAMFFDSLRAAPLYPREAGSFAAFLITVAAVYGMFKWRGLALLFAIPYAMVALRSFRKGWAWIILVTIATALLGAGCGYVIAVYGAGILALAGFALWVVVTLTWLAREVAPTGSTKGAVERRGDRSQRAGGVASRIDIWQRASRVVMQRRVEVLRPSLAAVPRRQRDPWAGGVLMAVVDGMPLVSRLTRRTREVWMDYRDAALRVGGPGTGKTISLAEVARRAPGALLTTSTRLDLAMYVQGDRMAYPKGHQQAGVKRAVHVFNPIGYGGVASTVMWSILVGCTDYTTAARRAGALLPEGDTAEGERWDTDGRTFLAVVLYAAAVGERNVQNVIRWIRLAGQDKTRDAANHELTEILDRDPDNAEKIGLLQQFMSINEKTRSSMTSTLTKALAWVSDNTARRIGAAPLEEVNLDVRQLILADETLHIVGPSTTGGMMQALTSALVDEFAYQARMLAGEMPGERLDPPVVMALDEAAVTVELPLPAWSADYGGRGIHLQIAVQSLAQLTDRWNKAGAATLRGNIGTLILYGGGVDADELEQISKLCGFHRRLVVGGAGEDTDHDGEVWERVPVLSVDDLSNLPQGQAAVLKRGLGGVVQARIPTVLNYGIRKLPLPGMAPIPAPTRRRGRPEAVEVDPAVLLPGLATGNAGEVVA